MTKNHGGFQYEKASFKSSENDGYEEVKVQGGDFNGYQFRTPEENRGRGFLKFERTGDFLEGYIHGIYVNSGNNGLIYNYNIWIIDANIPEVENGLSYSFAATNLLIERLDELPLPCRCKVIYTGKPAGKRYKTFKVLSKPLTPEEAEAFMADTANGMKLRELREIKESYLNKSPGGSGGGSQYSRAKVPSHNAPSPNQNHDYSAKVPSNGNAGGAGSQTPPRQSASTASALPSIPTRGGAATPRASIPMPPKAEVAGNYGTNVDDDDLPF